MAIDRSIEQGAQERATAAFRAGGVEASPVIFDIRKLQEILPHRYPFLFIDKVIEFVDNVRVTAIKNVTMNEPFFSGHFPNRPVMPGVIILEAMAQAGAVLALASSNGVPRGKLVFLTGCDEMRWKRQVVPGDTLRIDVQVTKYRRPLWIMKGSIFVEDKLVCSGTLSAAEGE